MERYTIGACGGLIRCNDDLRVASGEFAMMALNCNSAFARGLRAKGAPIGHVVPEDAATVGLDIWAYFEPQSGKALRSLSKEDRHR